MKQPTVFFDIETSGLDPFRHEVIQIGAVAIGKNVSTPPDFEVKVRFDPKRADPEALEMNSYDPDAWDAEAVSRREAAVRFARWMRPFRVIRKISRKGKPYSVARPAGHNITRFDLPFIREMFKAAGEFFPMEYIGMDTLQLATWFRATGRLDCENLKLETLARHYAIEHGDAHDALADVRVTAEVARRMLEEIDGEDTSDT